MITSTDLDEGYCKYYDEKGRVRLETSKNTPKDIKKPIYKPDWHPSYNKFSDIKNFDDFISDLIDCVTSFQRHDKPCKKYCKRVKKGKVLCRFK